MHTIQQLQLELAEARERNGTFTDESRISQENNKDASQYGQNDGNQLEMNGGGTSGGSAVALPNGNSDNGTSFGSTGNSSTQVTYSFVLCNHCDSNSLLIRSQLDRFLCFSLFKL